MAQSRLRPDTDNCTVHSQRVPLDQAATCIFLPRTKIHFTKDKTLSLFLPSQHTDLQVIKQRD